MGKAIDYNKPFTVMVTVGILAGGLYGLHIAEEDTVQRKVRWHTHCICCTGVLFPALKMAVPLTPATTVITRCSSDAGIITGKAS